MEKNMKENMKSLVKKFNEIKLEGWTASTVKGYGSRGTTFEDKIGKVRENFSYPDYEGIEIKTISLNDYSLITLFNSTPDGKDLFEISRLVQNYGFYSYKITGSKVFYGKVYGNKSAYLGSFEYKLRVDRKNEKIYLQIFNNNILIDENTYWEFSTLKQKFEIKLKYLALIRSECKIIDKKRYYNYKNITFYTQKTFDNFIKLIENGNIFIMFSASVHLQGDKKGQTHDHGTAFRMNKYNINKLFNKIYFI